MHLGVVFRGGVAHCLCSTLDPQRHKSFKTEKHATSSEYFLAAHANHAGLNVCVCVCECVYLLSTLLQRQIYQQGLCHHPQPSAPFCSSTESGGKHVVYPDYTSFDTYNSCIRVFKWSPESSNFHAGDRSQMHRLLTDRCSLKQTAVLDIHECLKESFSLIKINPKTQPLSAAKQHLMRCNQIAN